jgi:hypothetical protein
MSPKNSADAAAPFDANKFYRFSDLKTLGFVGNWNTLKGWIENFNCPPGTLIGHTRVWHGSELNAWYASRPTSRLFQNRKVA